LQVALDCGSLAVAISANWKCRDAVRRILRLPLRKEAGARHAASPLCFELLGIATAANARAADGDGGRSAILEQAKLHALRFCRRGALPVVCFGARAYWSR